MIPELEELYNKALSEADDARWLGHELACKYRFDLRCASEDCDKLEEMLSGEKLKLFKRYVKSEMDCLDLEQKVFFSKGFSAGLRLGVLCVK